MSLPRTLVRLLSALVVTVLLGGGLAVALSSPAPAAPRGETHNRTRCAKAGKAGKVGKKAGKKGSRGKCRGKGRGKGTQATATTYVADPGVVERSVTFEAVNKPDDLGACQLQADGQPVTLHATLVGNPALVDGTGGVQTINVLVHDAGTGGWFFDLGDGPENYARSLARQGQVSLVVDRLGYDASPLADGTRTCLDAQAAMLHAVVQHLYSAKYAAADGQPVPHASHVVVHGHGTGATIAQLESARFSDVSGLVLLSPLTTRSSSLATQVDQAQAQVCATGATYAPFGASDQTFADLLLGSAAPAVRDAAVRQRNSTPCGDVVSTSQAMTSAQGSTSDAAVLVLRGGQDARSVGDAQVTTTGPVTRVVVAGAGNALVLDQQAPEVRARVLQFLATVPTASR